MNQDDEVRTLNPDECIRALMADRDIVPPAYMNDLNDVLQILDSVVNTPKKKAFVFMLLHPKAERIAEIFAPFFGISVEHLLEFAALIEESGKKNLVSFNKEFLGYCIKVENTYHRFVIDKGYRNG